MIELDVNEFACIVPLLAGIKQRVLPYAICEGFNPGRVFADQRENPKTALIWTTAGYYFLLGTPSKDIDVADISEVLIKNFIPSSKAIGETGFIVVFSDDNWKIHLLTLLPNRKVIEIYRRPFTFSLERFIAQGDWRAQIPRGFSLQPVDVSLAEEVGVLGSWASVEDFLARGMGYVLMDGQKIASACTSVFVSKNLIEIDVKTDENYRRRGFAIITASALIEECLKHGKQPNWECFWEKESSIKLAQKIGFSALPDYPVYYWEE